MKTPGVALNSAAADAFFALFAASALLLCCSVAPLSPCFHLPVDGGISIILCRSKASNHVYHNYCAFSDASSESLISGEPSLGEGFLVKSII